MTEAVLEKQVKTQRKHPFFNGGDSESNKKMKKGKMFIVNWENDESILAA